MPIAALMAGLVCVVAWLYLLLAHGRFWVIPPTPASDAGFAGTIAAVIPARNEADMIGPAVASLLRQQGIQGVRLFVVDDNSTDGTGEAARRGASSRPDRITVIAGAPPPPGWSGKLWALQQGVEKALRSAPDYLLFTDADIEHAPEEIATLAGIAEGGHYDLASFMVKLHCRSVAEKLLIPAFVFFFFMLYPPDWIRDPRRSTAGAAGGCILVRAAALERIGGIAAIRQEVIDDCALARAVKLSGGNVWLGATADTHSLRPYRSFAEIGRMIARTAFSQLRHSAWLLLGTVAGMLLLYLLPLALLASGSAALAITGAVAYAMMTVAYLPMVRFYCLNPLWGLTLPFSALFYTAATMHSALRYWSGRGGEWKGRVQDPRRSRR